jgi:cytochrome c oxidase subunit 2
MRIVAQTQAMPGYTNILRYTFSQPGTYQVLCLEFCGLAHHDMKAEIAVAQ